jgi:alpha-L-fucosidase
VEGLRGGQWCELARGTSIGHKKIDPLAAVEVSRVRLRVVQAASSPQVRRLAAYHAGGAESPGHSIVEAFRYRILKTWTPASFTGERTSWDLDLTPFVKAAGEYEIEFVTTGGGLEVQSLTYLAGGVAANEYVRRDGRKNRFTINVTGLGLPLGARAVVRPRARSHGQVSLLRTN